MKPEKGENGYRYYTKEDIRNFLWIIYSRKLGFGLEEIVELKNEGERMFWISLKRTCFRRWKRKEL